VAQAVSGKSRAMAASAVGRIMGSSDISALKAIMPGDGAILPDKHRNPTLSDPAW
jgi:hypothetical protein